MDRFSNIEDRILFGRLDEIDGELQDWHISGYKSNLIEKEKEDIKQELRRRGYSL